MSDTQTKDDVLPGQIPGTNPNQPTSYQPSAPVSLVAPIVTAITGGDPGNTLAGIKGAQSSDNNFFGNIGSMMADVATKLQATFNLGKQVGAAGSTSNPVALAGQASALGQAGAQAIQTQGAAGAAIAYSDAMHKAKEAQDNAAAAVALHLVPNDPLQIQSIQNINDATKSFEDHQANLNKMRDVNFFDNPVDYLMNHLINIPIEASRRDSAVQSVVNEKTVMDARFDKFQKQTAVDAAINDVSTQDRAKLVYGQAMAQAAAAAIDPLHKSLQTQMSAWNLGIAQGELAQGAQRIALEKQSIGIQQEKLGMEKAEFPARMKLLNSQADYYVAGKQAQIDQMTATAAERKVQMERALTKDTQDKETLASVNKLISYLGGQGNYADINKIPAQHRDALLTLAANNDTFQGQLAQSPADVLRLLHESGIPLSNIPDSQKPTFQRLEQLEAEAISSIRQTAATTGVKPSSQDMAEMVRSYINTHITQEQNNVGSTNKFFAVPSVNTAVEADWAKTNPVMKYLKSAAIDANGSPIHRPMDGDMLMGSTVKMLQTNQINEQQAVQALKQYAEQTMNDVQTAGGFKRFGIPVQRKFPMLFSSGGGRIATVDLMDSKDILVKLRALHGAQKAAEMSDTFGSTPWPANMENFKPQKANPDAKPVIGSLITGPNMGKVTNEPVGAALKKWWQ